jgi:hypothetical protein
MISPVIACSECTIVGLFVTTPPIASVGETVITAACSARWQTPRAGDRAGVGGQDRGRRCSRRRVQCDIGAET